MQGVAVHSRELLDVESPVRHLVPAGTVFAFLGIEPVDPVSRPNAEATIFMGRRAGACHASRLTPLAMTRTDNMIADTDSVAISIFARCDSGMVSVGLNAEELVTET